MHNYAINNDYKIKVFFILSSISVFSVSFLKEWLTSFGPNAIYISIPSAFTLYGLCYLAFSKYIWKNKILNIFGLVQTPVVEGEWSGYLKSSFDDFQTEHNISIKIHQTWDKISIYLEGSTKESESTMASFRIINPSKSELEWAFLSKNKPECRDNDYMVYGIAKVKLDLIENNTISDEITGSYYTEKGVDTYGSIKLNRVK